MVGSVGHAWGILKGYSTGNKNQAAKFLNSMSPTQRMLQNRSESRARAKAKSKPVKFGRKPRRKR